MSKFTASVPLKLKWNGLYIEGPAGTEFQIPDAYYDEATSELQPVIAGFTWTSINDSNSSVEIGQVGGSTGAANTLLLSGATVTISGSTASVVISASALTYGSPASSAVGDSASDGVATSVSRSDHKHAREAFGSPVSSDVGDAASDGAATTVSRSDHQHAREGSGNPVTLGSAISAGTATTIALSDHVHTITGAMATAVPAATTPGTTSSLGAAVRAAYEDHVHSLAGFGTPSSTGTAVSAGTASTLTRSDHVHSIDNSLATATPPAIGTGSVGTTPRAAREDHTHTGAAGTGIAVSEIDGAPSSTGITGLVFSNGSVAISGTTATVTTGGSSGVTVGEIDGSPLSSSNTNLLFSNGSVTISGNTATVTTGGSGGTIGSTYLDISPNSTTNDYEFNTTVMSDWTSFGTLTYNAHSSYPSHLYLYKAAAASGQGGVYRNWSWGVGDVWTAKFPGFQRNAANYHRGPQLLIGQTGLTGSLHVFHLVYDGTLQRLHVDSYTTTGTYSSAPISHQGIHYGLAIKDLYLRIAYEATTVARFYWSLNGLIWQDVGSVALGYTPGSLGFGVEPQHASYPAEVMVDWLRYSTSVSTRVERVPTETHQSGSLTVGEIDGSPSSSGITNLVFPNGTLSISGSTASVTIPGQILAIASHTLTSDTTIATTTSTSMTAVDTTNLRISPIVPPNGKILIDLDGSMLNATSPGYWGLVINGSTSSGKTQMGPAQGNAAERRHIQILLTGLTAGTTPTIDFAHCVASGTSNLYSGPTLGSATISARAVP